MSDPGSIKAGIEEARLARALRFETAIHDGNLDVTAEQVAAVYAWKIAPRVNPETDKP